MGLPVGDVLFVEYDLPPSGAEKSRYQVEDGRLPCPVGSDEADKLSFPNVEIESIDGGKTTEVFSQAFDSKRSAASFLALRIRSGRLTTPSRKKKMMRSSMAAKTNGSYSLRPPATSGTIVRM